MSIIRKLLPFILLGFALAHLAPQLAAQTPNRAALVVRLDDGSVQTSCIEFSEAQITGYDLLLRSGLDVESDVQGMGALVCNIEGAGCPTSNCWCQCQGGGSCEYWSYWHQVDGSWDYSQVGAAAYPVLDGAVEGWSWGPGSVTDAIAPPVSSFEFVCGGAATAVPVVDEGMGEDTAVSWLPYIVFLFILPILGLLIWRAKRQTK